MGVSSAPFADRGLVSGLAGAGRLAVAHVAAHVDALASWIVLALEDGHVILDRFWRSTYAYARSHMGADAAWALVAAEHPFWRPLPRPTIFYVTRSARLKSDELDPQAHDRLDRHYREVIDRERSSDVEIHVLSNDGELDDRWSCLLRVLGLLHAPL